MVKLFFSLAGWLEIVCSVIWSGGGGRDIFSLCTRIFFHSLFRCLEWMRRSIFTSSLVNNCWKKEKNVLKSRQNFGNVLTFLDYFSFLWNGVGFVFTRLTSTGKIHSSFIQNFFFKKRNKNLQCCLTPWSPSGRVLCGRNWSCCWTSLGAASQAGKGIIAGSLPSETEIKTFLTRLLNLWDMNERWERVGWELGERWGSYMGVS